MKSNRGEVTSAKVEISPANSPFFSFMVFVCIGIKSFIDTEPTLMQPDPWCENVSRRIFSFKTDTSFLKKITLGATATKKVQEILNAAGHTIIELERGALSTDIWKEIKMKRIRVPDLLCVKCGIRVECRGKSRLEMTMSHSYARPDRQWDAGLLDDDWVAFIQCHKASRRPTDWVASQYVSIVRVGDLKATQKQARVKAPKGVTEGSEVQITWPARICSKDGKVIDIGDKTITIRTTSRRPSILRLFSRGKIEMKPNVRVGEKILGKQQFVASLAPLITDITCKGGKSVHDFARELDHPEFSVRFAAARALGALSE